jgi:hypothetical protein
MTITTLISFIAAALAQSQKVCYAAVASSSVVLILPVRASRRTPVIPRRSERNHRATSCLSARSSCPRAILFLEPCACATRSSTRYSSASGSRSARKYSPKSRIAQRYTGLRTTIARRRTIRTCGTARHRRCGGVRLCFAVSNVCASNTQNSISHRSNVLAVPELAQPRPAHSQGTSTPRADLVRGVGDKSLYCDGVPESKRH